MKHLVAVLFVSVCYLSTFSVGLRPYIRPHPWPFIPIPSPPPPPPPPPRPKPRPPPPPPVEQLPFTVVTSSLAQGFSLTWDNLDKVLFFVDVSGQTLYRYDPATTVLKSLTFDTPVSFAIPIAEPRHNMVLGLGGELVTLKWYWTSNDFATSHLFSTDPRGPRVTWGTGKADNKGRIWAEGLVQSDTSFGQSSTSRLYYLDTASSCSSKISFNDTDVSSGMAWSPDNTVLYYSSSSNRVITAFDFDSSSGSISNPRTVFDFGDYPGSPAGLTVDGDGFLWIGAHDSNFIFKADPNLGRLVRVIKLPVTQVTSLAFGGPNLQDLYLTTKGTDGSSSVLKISGLNSKGVPSYPVTLLCEPCNEKNKLSQNSIGNNWWCFYERPK